MELTTNVIDGPYPALAAMVQKVLKGRQHMTDTSTRALCRRLGMSHETIAGMASGHRPARSLVIEFAQGMGVPVNDLLAAADYPLVGPQTFV